jgi:hypothetical protein
MCYIQAAKSALQTLHLVTYLFLLCPAGDKSLLLFSSFTSYPGNKLLHTDLHPVQSEMAITVPAPAADSDVTDLFGNLHRIDPNL